MSGHLLIRGDAMRIPLPAGSGTTLVVANALGRRAIGLDLSPDYLALAQRRVTRPHAAIPRPGRADEVHPLFDRAGESA